MYWDDYSWDALDYLESRCMDSGDAEDKECREEEDE